MKALIAASILVLLGSCTGAGDREHPLPADTSSIGRHGAVVRLQLVPIPEGPPAPSFERNAPAGDEWVRSLDKVQKYMPAHFPGPLEQPGGCNLGGDLIVTFADGFKLTYGPCVRPRSINGLWAGMVYVLDNGNCAPKCGPGGSPGP